MIRIATYRWCTPAPTSVDEELALFDDGAAWLVVRRPRQPSPAIGTFVADHAAAGPDVAVLAAAGPAPIEFDLLEIPADASLMAAADRVAGAARSSPRAVAQFLAAPQGGGHLSLVVVGKGTEPVQFSLDPAGCSVHFTDQGQPTGWREFPPLSMGFMTPDAGLLGGLGAPARVPPAAVGAIALDVAAPEGASAVYVQVAGWLSPALSDDDRPARFQVRTAEVSLVG